MLLDMPTHAFEKATSKTPENLYFIDTIELFVKYSKEGTKSPYLLKTGNKVVEVGWLHNKNRG
jgi:hypothetical protein